MLDDDNLMKSDNDKEEKHLLHVKKQQLTSLLKKPVFPKGFSSEYYQIHSSRVIMKKYLEIMLTNN